MLQYVDSTKDKLIKRKTLSKHKTNNTDKRRKQSNSRDIQRIKRGTQYATDREFYVRKQLKFETTAKRNE
jgi:hypothetical protein